MRSQFRLGVGGTAAIPQRSLLRLRELALDASLLCQPNNASQRSLSLSTIALLILAAQLVHFSVFFRR